MTTGSCTRCGKTARLTGVGWEKENPDKRNAYSREYAKGKWRDWHNEYRRGRKGARAEEARKYRAKNPDAARERRRNYYAKNKDKLLKYRSDYLRKHPWFNRAASSRNRAIIKQRTVPWADLEAIKEFYRNCPNNMVVDHIIPLKGKNVCGLHVLSNLQHMTPEENRAKSNNLLEDLWCVIKSEERYGRG